MHIPSNFIDQNPDALRLTVVEGNLDTRQFQVYSQQDVVFGKFTVSAQVIGASHILSVRCGDLQLNEIFACVGLPEVVSFSLHDVMQGPMVREYLGLGYTFEARSVLWLHPAAEPSDLVSLVAAARSNSRDVSLVVDFPQGNCAVTPKTVIVGGIEDEGFLVFETAHSYPNVPGLVMSRSTFVCAQEVPHGTSQ